MKIENPSSKSPLKAGFFLLLAIVIAIFLFSLLRPRVSAPFEIGNFSGKAEIYSLEKKEWIPANRGDVLSVGTSLRTGPDSEVSLVVPGKIQLRVKEATTIQTQKGGGLLRPANYRLALNEGVVIGATGKGFGNKDVLEIKTPVSVAAVRGTLFRVEYKPKTKESWASVLQGNMEVRKKGWGFGSVNLRNLQRTSVKSGEAPLKPTRVSRDEWNLIKEAYDLIEKTAAFEAAQKDLSKDAGSLFDFVFDHGTFYIPKFGFSDREFVRNDLTQQVHLNVMYDVFPVGSFAGMYMKTRQLDLRDFDRFEFLVRRMPDEDFPEAFRIEFKSKGQVVRAFAPKVFKSEWRLESFNLQVRQPTPVDEVTFVFSHDRVGEHKKGTLQFQELQLIPKEKEQAEEAVTPA